MSGPNLFLRVSQGSQFLLLCLGRKGEACKDSSIWRPAQQIPKRSVMRRSAGHGVQEGVLERPMLSCE